MAGLAGLLAYAAALAAIGAMAATSIRQLRYIMLLAGIGGCAHFALLGQIGWAIIVFVFVAVNAIQISVLRRRARRGAMLEEEVGLFDRLRDRSDSNTQHPSSHGRPIGQVRVDSPPFGNRLQNIGC